MGPIGETTGTQTRLDGQEQQGQGGAAERGEPGGAATVFAVCPPRVGGRVSGNRVAQAVSHAIDVPGPQQELGRS